MASIWERIFGGAKKKRADLIKALGPPTKTQRTMKQKKSWVYNPKTRKYEPPAAPASVVKKRFEAGGRGSGTRSFKKRKKNDF